MSMNLNWRLPTHPRNPPTDTTNDPLQARVYSPPHTSANDINDFILYNQTYRVQICAIHGFAVRNLRAHLRDEHTLPPARRKAILEAHADDVCVRPNKLGLPQDLVDPVEGLCTPVVAHRCRDESCLYTSPSDDVIRQHANKEHGWRKSPDEPTYWHRVHAQTFFTSRGFVKWFAVRVSEGAAPDSISGHSRSSRAECPPTPGPSGSAPSQYNEDDFARITQEWTDAREKHVQTLQVMDAETLKQDRTGWYSRNEWPQHLAKRNLRYVAHASRLPDRDELVLQEAIRVLNLVLHRAVAGLSSLEHELRRWLRSAKQSEPDVRPLSRLEDPNSQDRYYGYLRRFTCLFLRVALSIEEQQREQREELARQTARHVHRENTPSEDRYDSETDESDRFASGDESDEDDSDYDIVDGNDRGVEHQGTRRGAEREPISQEDTLKDARELFPWHGEQKARVLQLYDMLSLPRTTSNLEDHRVPLEDEAKMQAMLAVYQSFIFHKLAGQKFKSALVHFLAVLGIDEENNRLRRASDFSYILAGVVYCVRVLGVEILLPSTARDQQEGDDSVREEFLEQRRSFLADGSGTPMSIMLSLLAYSKHVAMNTGNTGSVSWSKDKKTMYFRGRAIEITLFREMIVGAIQRAEDMLWRELMWVHEVADRFEVPLHPIVDDVTFTRRGISFISKRSNGLTHGLDWMLKRLLSQPLKQCLRTQGHWRTRRIRRYLRRVDDFLGLLLFCMHTTYGQPARGTEITSTRFQNGCLQDRNVFVIDGQVVVVTRYHKSQSQFDRPKVVPRFLPWRVGQLLVIYLAYVQRLREHLLVQVQGQGWSDHIWCNDKGVWETNRMTSIIKQETAMGLGRKYTTLDYRHIAVSIGRVKVGESFASGYKEEVGEVEEPEVEEENGLDLQSGRGEQQGSLKYGVPIDIIAHLSVRSLETFRPLSEGWHRFLGLASTAQTAAPPATPRLDTNKRARAITTGGDARRPEWRALFSGSGPQMRDEPGRTLRSSGDVSEEGLANVAERTSGAGMSFEERQARVEKGMRQLFGGERAVFRSREQEEGLHAVLRGETPLVMVLPTGGGKTVLAMVPAVLDSEGVTIVVAPFRALVDDMVRRFRRAGIDCLEWRFGEVNPATVVVVSADIAASYGFLSYARVLQQDGLLRRIFVDECHLTFTSSDWRPKLFQLRQLRTLSCPIVLLTATLPPMLVFELEETMLVRNARYIRSSTVRAQHRYQVQRCRPGELVSEAIKLCARRQRHLNRQKGVVYCLSRAGCTTLAQELGCLDYHAGLVDRAERLERWAEQGGLIVATSALGTGVDFPGIVFVLHVDMPWSMIDFAQESGRAGRGGELVDSVILVEEESVERKAQRQMLALDTSAMATFITTEGCRRRMMSEYLDGADLAQECGDIPGAARCDHCGEGLVEAVEAEREAARQWQLVKGALDDMTEGCAWCWVEEGEDIRPHGMLECPRGSEERTAWLDGFRRQITYNKKSHTCTRCGVSQKFCATGLDEQKACQWPNVVVVVLCLAMGNVNGREMVQRVGYDGEVEDWGGYARWLGQRHIRRVWGEWMSNGMVVLIKVILYALRVDG